MPLALQFLLLYQFFDLDNAAINLDERIKAFNSCEFAEPVATQKHSPIRKEFHQDFLMRFDERFMLTLNIHSLLRIPLTERPHCLSHRGSAIKASLILHHVARRYRYTMIGDVPTLI
jgi:hypothetical protein|tara:strand:- start:260 stop:610 length:351 start_codon:yes stop_codon:yes gene_type:complete